MDDELAHLSGLIRSIPDYPKVGILFRDATTLLADGDGFALCITRLAALAAVVQPAMIAGIEARGFIFGAAVAVQLGVGFLPVRKRGKLPVPTIGIDYALEYGTDRLELDPSVVPTGGHVLLVDDLLATGGTALAAASLIRTAGGSVSNALFAIELPALGGAVQLASHGITAEALLAFDGH